MTEEIDELEGGNGAFGHGFSKSFQTLLEQLIRDLNSGIPGPFVDGPISNMLAYYSQAASTLGYIRDAVQRGDEEAALRHMDTYIEVANRANRIAKRFKLVFCVATVTEDLEPDPEITA